MKKLLLIALLFLITPDAKADMNYICELETPYYISEYIAKNCQRNNILLIQDIPSTSLPYFIASWCRQDREINYIPQKTQRHFHLTCVLYDNKPRKSFLEEPLRSYTP